MRREAALEELQKLGVDISNPELEPAEPEVVLEMRRVYLGNLETIKESDPEEKKAAVVRDTVEKVNEWYARTGRTLEPTNETEVRETLEKYFGIAA